MKKGLSFEKKVLRELRRLNDKGTLPGAYYPSQWIAFRDENGLGFAQPDAFIVMGDCVLLFEVKLTQTFYAVEQCRFLYRPLLEHIFRLPVFSLQVCKSLREADEYLIDHPAQLLVEKPSHVRTWLYTGP